MSVYLCPSLDTYDACQLLELELARPTCFMAINYRIMAGLRKDRGAASFFSTHLSRQFIAACDRYPPQFVTFHLFDFTLTYCCIYLE
ncbi:hypothetical protein C8J56DRAFT_1048285 [Mycena floridula]|nr:hypothetical protein C8J56DRAFT_1048285 [Mycena floridula]